MMIVSEDSDFKNKITIKFERAVMSGSIQVKNNFFNSLQTQLSVKNERPARLELVINDKLNINKNGILFLEQELTSDIMEYKFYKTICIQCQGIGYNKFRNFFVVHSDIYGNIELY